MRGQTEKQVQDMQDKGIWHSKIKEVKGYERYRETSSNTIKKTYTNRIGANDDFPSIEIQKT